ncbi:response regulator [Leptolyngbya cf. ectocarpi LEGE 11479]|uniref:Response regulator n=1 Tax=Leptolyngbya cf. ectocarpi LEGE 11479 TaxID=1828722 RepID=A0A928ZRT3_LEPEC|nr:response regulator [Leptolyngbya ectocarpi]MBE9067018.1 response regulator [Leptolyngbya cf. ectocarpi LEGE 11479]
METKHILIIDDDADIREATQLCLEITGHWDVLKASNGQEGIAIAQTEHPDVILLDMMMPGMDGLTILERLQDNPQTQQIPIIILTAKAQSHEQEFFRQLKVLSVITKPYDPMTISDQIFSALP